MSARRVLTAAALLCGPLLSWVLLRNWLPASSLDLSSAEAALTLAWCPWVFFSVPALALQSSRDASLPQMSGAGASVVRAIALVPYELTYGTRRAENWASVAGWVALLTLTWASVASVTARLLEPLIP